MCARLAQPIQAARGVDGDVDPPESAALAGEVGEEGGQHRVDDGRHGGAAAVAHDRAAVDARAEVRRGVVRAEAGAVDVVGVRSLERHADLADG